MSMDALRICSGLLSLALPLCGAYGQGLDWHFMKGASRHGDIVTVVVPEAREDASPGTANAYAFPDLSPFAGTGFTVTVRARAEHLSKPAAPHLGFKFMVHYRDPDTGADAWPGATVEDLDFDWREVSVSCPDYPGSSCPAKLVLGLEEASGKVEFDLSTLRIEQSAPLWPPADPTLRCRYSDAVRDAPVRRGVMSPERPMTEDDMATLRDWGATLIRYQMVRDWFLPDANQDLDEYDRWLDGRLDHFERFVLPAAERLGMKAVLDLHVVPGGRERGGEMHMFHDARYADHFIALWRRIATRFRGRPGLYGYDLVNEPVQTREALPGCDYWSLQRRAAEAVREVDPDTPVIIEANRWDAPSAFRYLAPVDLPNVLYQVHMYVPHGYTHQNVAAGKPRPPVAYPDPARGLDRDFLRRALAPVREFERRHGAKIYVGEFSAVAWAPGADAYLRDCIDLFAEYGWDWTYHAFREWNGGSVEHEGPDARHLAPSPDNPRMRALKDGLSRP